MKKMWIAALMTICAGVATAANAQSLQDNFTKGAPSARPLAVTQKPQTFPVDVKVRNEATSESVNVDVDRKDKKYYKGDLVKISVRSSADGYLYLFALDKNGAPTLLLPNKQAPEVKIKKETTVTYPTAEQKNFDFEVVGEKAEDFGAEKIVAYVTQEPLKSATKSLDDDATVLTAEEAKAMVVELEALANQDGSKAVRVRVKDDGETEPTQPLPANKPRAMASGECAFYTALAPEGKPQQTASKEAKRIVVCFGLNKYGDKRIPTLTLCAKDAQSFADVAQKNMGVDAKMTLVVTDEQATLGNARRVICEILPKFTEPGDEVIIYWSGHGDKIATAQNAANDSFLVTYDGRLEDPINTMLTEDKFGNWIQNSLKGRRVMVFLDACYSGALLTGDGYKGMKGIEKDSLSSAFEEFEADEFNFGEKWQARSKSLGADGTYVLASSSKDQFSYEGKRDLGMSVATYYLCETISKGDANLKHTDLKPAMRNKVADYVKKNRSSARQTIVDFDGLGAPVKMRRTK